jgi:DNA-binding PucR family transcriptional regulator
MDDELQMIVDLLSQRVRRPAAIDDPQGHLLAYSAHEDNGLDRVRMTSILTLDTPPDAQKWIRSQGVLKATGPVRLEANQDLAMDARVCVPVRANGVLLGFFWLTDSEPSLDEEELSVATQAADAAAAILYRHQFPDHAHRERELALTNQLLAGDRDMRASAAAGLADECFFRHSGPVGVFVVRTRQRLADAAPEPPLDTMMGQALDHFRRSLAPHKCLVAPRGDHGVAIVASDEPALRISGLTDLATKLIELLEATVATDTQAWISGCSTSPNGPSDAFRAYREALDAALIAERIPDLGPVANWSELGPYRHLAQLVTDLSAELPDPIEKLLALPAESGLAETLECYLDLAGDVKASAGALALHRASLYYRLEKIERVTGRDLKCGDDRLELHMGLKMARLLQVYPARD